MEGRLCGAPPPPHTQAASSSPHPHPPPPHPMRPCTGKALLDTLSKKKYGAQLRQQGGWAFMQEMLQVRGRNKGRKEEGRARAGGSGREEEAVA